MHYLVASSGIFINLPLFLRTEHSQKEDTAFPGGPSECNPAVQEGTMNHLCINQLCSYGFSVGSIFSWYSPIYLKGSIPKLSSGISLHKTIPVYNLIFLSWRQCWKWTYNMTINIKKEENKVLFSLWTSKDEFLVLLFSFCHLCAHWSHLLFSLLPYRRLQWGQSALPLRAEALSEWSEHSWSLGAPGARWRNIPLLYIVCSILTSADHYAHRGSTSVTYLPSSPFTQFDLGVVWLDQSI